MAQGFTKLGDGVYGKKAVRLEDVASILDFALDQIDPVMAASGPEDGDWKVSCGTGLVCFIMDYDKPENKHGPVAGSIVDVRLILHRVLRQPPPIVR